MPLPAFQPARGRPAAGCRVRALAFAVLVAAALPAAGEIYKCVDAQGKPTYQQQPCAPASATAPVVEAKPGAAGTAAPVRPATPPPGGVAAGPAAQSVTYDSAVGTLVAKVAKCSEMLREAFFNERTEAGWRRWYADHLEAIQAYQRTPDYGRAMAEAKGARLAPGTRPPAQAEQECKDTQEFLVRQAPR